MTNDITNRPIPRHPYAWRTSVRKRLPWFLIDLGVARKGINCEFVGAQHHWYNLDGARSACYHCRVIGDGSLWSENS
jgi:hypothetical protein